MKTYSKFKAAIFDLDGTLIDSLFELGTITNSVLSSNGFPTHTIDKYRTFVGDGAKTLITRTLPESHRNKSTIEKCLDDFLATYRKRCGEAVTVYDGIPELLMTLENQGIRLGILSNKPHELTIKNVDLLLPKTSFEIVLGERKGVPKKPDPSGAVEIAETLGIAPSRCLYLGDTGVDMKTAVSAGMYPVGVLWGFREKKELLENGAKTLIKRPSELLQLLKQGI